MEDIKSWGLLMVFLSVGSLIYCFLIPSGASSRLSRGIVSLVVIMASFMPVFSVFGSLTGTEFTFSSPPETADYSDYFEQQAKKAVEEIIKPVIRKYTVVPYETEIFINKDDTGSINIEYIAITFSAKPLSEKELTDELVEALGIIPDIRVEYTDG